MRSARALELWRDPVRLAFALLGTAFLMLVFGFGITTDVDTMPFAVLDRDQTPRKPRLSRGAARLALFRRTGADSPTTRELERRLADGELKAAIEIPPGFGRDVERGRPAEVGAWIDGAMPFRAETIRGYLQGVHQHYLADPASAAAAARPSRRPTIEMRFRYNQDFESVYAMVPAIMALLLVLIPAILMALADRAREGARLDHQSLRHAR